MAKLNPGSVLAYSAYASSVAAMATDGNSATRWESNTTYAGTINEILVLGFGQPVTPKQIRILFSLWGPDLRIGYSQTGGTVKANYTELKNIIFASEPNDSAGKPWVFPGTGVDLNNQNVILLPDNTIAAKFWGIWVNDTTNVDRLRVWEISMYDTVGDEGANPTIPAIVPASPFTTTPNAWKRTEYATVGQFTHVPDADTKLMLVAAQGAGSGGVVNINMDGTPAPVTAYQGGDAIVATADGNILVAPGAAGSSVAAAISQFNGKTKFDWSRYTNLGSAASNIIAAGNSSGSAGGLASMGGTAGVAYTLSAQNTNSGMTASNNFRTADAVVPVTLQNYTRGSADGYRSDAVEIGVACSMEMTFNAYAGQVVNITYGKGGSSTSFGTVNVYANDQLLVSDAAAFLGSKSFAYTVTQTGPVTIKQTCTRTGTNAAAYVYLSNIAITGVGQGGSFGGASGRQGQLIMAPATLNLTVPKGGIGQPAGQPLTSAHNGTRGSGGSSGGNGGDGVIVVYEYKGFMSYSEPIDYSWANYNVATNPMAGIYRTDYVGQGLGLTQNYVHKLRPRTKNVLVLLSGAGGGLAQIINSPTTPAKNDPTIVSCGTKTFSAGSGGSSWRYSSSDNYPCSGGDPGVFTGNGETIWQSNGVSTGTNAASSIGVFGSYGASKSGVQGAGQGINNSTWSGGSGAAALLLLGESDLTSGEISIQVSGQGPGSGPNPYDVGNPGVVVIYETETISSPRITQLIEQLLVKGTVSATNTTQITEQLLTKQGIGNSQTTQNAELLLVKEGEQNNSLQVSYANVGFIVDAGDPETWTTQTAEQLLLKQARTNTQLTQSAEMILARVPRIPYRMTQLAELIFVSEIPTVFWLNFGEINDPVKNQMYTSLTGRASSVQPGAYIQLEGPVAEGTTMFVNGVDVGLSSPIANNDRVHIVGGIPNWWQPSINVYTYYLTNGEVTREQVGMWLFKHPVRVPAKPRAYSMQYANNKWVLTKTYYSMANIRSIFTKALSALANLTLGTLVTRGYSQIGPVMTTLVAKTNAAKASLGQMVSKAYHALAKGADSIITKAQISKFVQDDFVPAQNYFGRNGITFDSGVDVGAAYYEMTVQQLQAAYGFATQDQLAAVGAPGAALLENAEFIESNVYSSGVEQSYESVPQGNVDFVEQEYQYNAVGKSFSNEQEYIAMLSTGFAAPFYMGFTDSIAYSVLNSFEFINYQYGGTGTWDMPGETAELAKAKMVLMQMFPAEKSDGHTEFVQRTPVPHGAHEFHNFITTPMVSGIGISKFQQSAIKRVERVTRVQINWVRVKAQMGVWKNTPYRNAQNVNGRGKASLYMGFDTLADVQNYTSNYSDVTTLQMYNGYTYNVGVDKSFICEIYFNGPISGLIRGG